VWALPSFILQMGLLLSRTTAADLQLPREIKDRSVGEQEARSSGPLRVLDCPRCHRRLCTLGRAGRGAPAVWKAPISRVERGFFSGGTSFKCRACGQGRITVETLSPMDVAAAGSGEDASDDQLPQVVALRGAPRNAFRPFSACVCGVYDSVVGRAANLLQADAISDSRTINVIQKTLRRSELAKFSESDLPPYPMELLVVAHKISGQRNPLTDTHGLYNALLKQAWHRADVVLLILFDVPVGSYFLQLLEEQPTLRSLLCAGRLLPLFNQDARGDEIGGGDAEASGNDAADVAVRPTDVADGAWWLLRCLDGRVPRSEAYPEGGNNSAKVQDTVNAASDGASVGSAISVLAPVAEFFDGMPLVRD